MPGPSVVLEAHIMRASQRELPGERPFHPLRWLERLFLMSGVLALIWCAVVVTDREIAQRNAQSALEIATALEELTRAAPVTQGAVHIDEPRIETGAVLAALSIPRVQLSAMVLHGSDARTLARGPGHLEHTAVPGEAGNVVIAGHRDSFFRPLRHIRDGDDIYLETRIGHFHYRVTSLRVVGPREVSVIAPTTEDVLTLITCYPFSFLGQAPDRFIVRAARVDDRAVPLLAARNLPVGDRLPAPVLDRRPSERPLTMPVVAPEDDESLVRQVVRRYLATQGVQPARCWVNVAGDRAGAECEPNAYTPGGRQQPWRAFALERSNRAWAIRSILLSDAPSARESQETQP
jgi:sortase A